MDHGASQHDIALSLTSADMLRIVRIALIALALLAVGVVGYGLWRNPERSTLDTAARASIPGRFVALSGGITHYEVAGPDSGRVVVLVHGFSVPSYIWDSTFQALARTGHRVIRYDLYGRGWSDRPDAAYDGALYDRQLAELLDSLRVTQSIDLVGLSFGGFVTAHYTVRHADRVRTLTLIDPVASSRAIPDILSTPVIGSWLWQVTLVPTLPDGQMSDFLHPERHPTWVAQYRPQMRYRGFGRSLLRSALVMGRIRFDSLYAQLAPTMVPVLLVWGKQDRTVPIELAEVITRSIPATEFFPVDSAGHLRHIEQAATVNTKLQAFLAAHPIRPPEVPGPTSR
jgi:pimeloyl-ACP methyl ester carboxylesterase